MTQAIENNPITISLTALALSSGWSVDGSIALHDSCNSGNLYILNYPLTIGQSYRYTYTVLTRISGYVQAFLGTNSGAEITTVTFVDETVVANGVSLYLFSNGTLSITNFAIELIEASASPTQQNTVAYSEDVDKWTSFYSYIPDNAFSMFTDTWSFYQGNVYLHEQAASGRCSFYGVQYPAQISFSTNEQPTISKTFLSLNYQSNQLLISPLGINTSTGQLSDLGASDFIQAEYNDGSIVYEVEGIFKASFLRDMYVDLVNGPPLKGNWATVNLITTTPSAPVNLFSTEISYNHSFSNTR